MYLRLLIVSIFAALILSALSLLCLSRLSDLAAGRHRGDFLLFLADSIERRTADLSIEDLKSSEGQERLRENPFPRPPGPGPFTKHLHHGDFPPPPPGPSALDRFGPPLGAHFPPPPPDSPRFGGRRGPKPAYWLVSEQGDVLFQSLDDQPLPVSWAELPKPDGVHEVTSQEDFFRLFPGFFVVQLDKQPTLYLVVRDDRRPFFGPLFYTQALLTFGTVATAIFFSLSLTFFYLRRKSEEASAVLLRLERGDLKARFDIKRFDEFGGLLLDFNRMAEEIERLVNRVHATEAARKNLLKELGHDLRTPLTSLRTSFETLKEHFPKMTDAQRADLFEMISAEVEYFRELLEKLMTIADLDEPHYKSSTELIDLAELLNQEIKSRQATGPTHLQWKLSTDVTRPQAAATLGDSHLILRLFKNALDNAGRFARTRVNIEVISTASKIEIRITDDGPGLSAAELESFGKRRETRTRREGSALNFSLGLGSVIMKTIAELHGGEIQIENASSSVEPPKARQGARLTIRLPHAEHVKSGKFINN